MEKYVCSQIVDNVCTQWVAYESVADGFYKLISAAAITPTLATQICTGIAAIHIVSYLLKLARRSAT